MNAIKINGECSKRCQYWLSEELDRGDNNPSPFHCSRVWEEPGVIPQRPGRKCPYKDHPVEKQSLPVAKLIIRGASKFSDSEVKMLIDWLDAQKKTIKKQRAELSGIFTAKLWRKE